MSLVENNRGFEIAAMSALDVPYRQIAHELGINKSTVQHWLRKPEVQEQIAQIKESVHEGTKHMAVADRVRRIAHAQKMVDRLLAVIEARAKAAAADPDALPEERTGLMATEITSRTIVGRQGNTTTVTSRKVRHDSSLHEQLRRWFEFVAREKGELVDNLKVQHTGSVEHVNRNYDYSRLSDDELVALAQISAKARVEEMTQ